MRWQDIAHETAYSLLSNKTRSGLTMLGIIIGVASVVALISIGESTQANIMSRIQAIGSNLIVIVPGAPREFKAGANLRRGSAQTLTIEDAKAIRSGISQVSLVAPEITQPFQIVSRGANTLASVVGTWPAYASIRKVTVAQGKFFSDQEEGASASVAVLGATVMEDLFGSGSKAEGQLIRINQMPFKVIGIAKTKGAAGAGSADNVVYVPFSSTRKLLSGVNYLTAIDISAKDGNKLAQTQKEITGLLLRRHRIKSPQPADFSVLNQADVVSAASSVTSLLTLLLGGIAGISLIVGGIGIMNMMFTTVVERTREIGLRQAVGATRRDIAGQFLAEAVVLTLSGGIIGIPIGWLIAMIYGQFSKIKIILSLNSIFLALGVAIIVGLVFGYLPALRASRLKPIEALRYE